MCPGEYASGLLTEHNIGNMKPYIITSMSLITYSGRKIPLEIVESHILTKPLKAIKEKLLDAFSTMIDKPVNVELKIRHI